MKRLFRSSLLLLSAAALLAGCSQTVASSNGGISAGSVASGAAVASSKTASAVNTAEALTLEDAKDLFLEAHPDAEITVAKREGDVYYIEGRSGTVIYKMKFLAASGEVVLDKTIEK